jgi:hypothetical protein
MWPQPTRIRPGPSRPKNGIALDVPVTAVAVASLFVSVSDCDPSPSLKTTDVARRAGTTPKLLDGDAVLSNESQTVGPHRKRDSNVAPDAIGSRNFESVVDLDRECDPCP